jgi:hypothetical protein
MKRRFSDGLALGLALGFIFSALIFWVIDETSGVVESSFKETATHIVTLFAAAIALFGISNQIGSSERLVESARLAKLDAARSSLPIVLSNIVQMCDNRCRQLVAGKKQPLAGFWSISDFELQTLKECIEFADGYEKSLMQQIIRIYQVLIARWDQAWIEDLFAADVLEKGDPRTLDRRMQYSAIVDWLTIRELANALFPSSRGAQIVPKLSEIKDRVLNSLEHVATEEEQNAGWLLINHKNYSDFIAERRENRYVAFLDRDWNS